MNDRWAGLSENLWGPPTAVLCTVVDACRATLNAGVVPKPDAYADEFVLRPTADTGAARSADHMRARTAADQGIEVVSRNAIARSIPPRVRVIAAVEKRVPNPDLLIVRVMEESMELAVREVATI